MLVTDAISALGLEEGIHQLGQMNIEVRDGKAYIAGTDTLCGSIADMSECVRFFKRAAGKKTHFLSFLTNRAVFHDKHTKLTGEMLFYRLFDGRGFRSRYFASSQGFGNRKNQGSLEFRSRG